MNPEDLARINIDNQLKAAGWEIQDREKLNLGAGLGVAVRYFPLETGEADYMLFVDRKAAGVVEAKAEGTTLGGVDNQTDKYTIGLSEKIPNHGNPLPFSYWSAAVF